MECKTFVAGVVIGGVIALLYAPNSGKKTRQLIKDTATEFVDEIKEEANEVVDTVKEAASESSRKGKAAVKAIKS